MDLRTQYPRATQQYALYRIQVPDEASFKKFFNDQNAIKPNPSPSVAQQMYIVKIGEPVGTSKFMTPDVDEFNPGIEGIMSVDRSYLADDKAMQKPFYTVKYFPMCWSQGKLFIHTTYDLNDAWATYQDCIHWDMDLWEKYLTGK